MVCLDASQELRTRLQILQNSCVRYVLAVRADEHITPHRSKLGWMRTDTRRDYFMAVILYKTLRDRKPDYLFEIFCQFIPWGPTRGVAKELVVSKVRIFGTPSRLI